MKTILFSSLLLLCLVFTQVTLGFSTHKEAQSYLRRYGIPHDELDESQLVATVKQYRDMAVLNTELFGDRVERLLEGLDKKLEDHYGVTESHQRQRLLKDIERVLRPLEVQGQLTRDHVHSALADDTNKLAVSSSQFLTSNQWQQVIKDVEGFVTPPSTWSRWFGQSSDSIIKIGDKDPYHVWLDETSLPFAAYLTVPQHQTLKTALDKAMKQEELGSKEWWQQFIKALHGFSVDQVEHVMADLRIKVLGFKIFAHDYLGLPSPAPVYEEEQEQEQEQGLLGGFISWLKAFIQSWVVRGQQVDEQASSFLAKKKEQGQQLQDEWVKAIQHTQHSFATYWHDRQYEAYRRIGYTEGEIDWIKSYLNKALHPSSSSVSSFGQIMNDVRNYLNSLERQTKAQVELHVLKLDRLLQAWKVSVLGGGRHMEL